MFHKRFKSVSTELQGVSRNFQGGFKNVSRVFQKVSRVFQEFFRGDSWKFQRSLQASFKWFQQGFKEA